MLDTISAILHKKSPTETKKNKEEEMLGDCEVFEAPEVGQGVMRLVFHPSGKTVFFRPMPVEAAYFFTDQDRD